jgi:hypothetical protein
MTPRHSPDLIRVNISGVGGCALFDLAPGGAA